MASSPLTFYLKRSIIQMEYRAPDGRALISTRIKVDETAYRNGKAPKDVKAMLRRIETAIDTYEANMRMAGRQSAKADIERLVFDVLGIKAGPKRVQGTPFLAYYGQYLQDIEAGTVLNRGKKYSKSFIKIAQVVSRLLPALKIAKVPVEAITEETLRELAAELTARKFAKNTVATYMDPIMSFLIGGRRSNRHNGPQLESRSFRVPREDVDHGVYLNDAEQDLIAAVELDGDAARLRDAFLFGCQVGMRHSDLMRLTPQHRRGDVVNINTTKTTTPVWVPLNARARELWDRHSGVFNIPAATPFLLIIKDLGEAAGIDKDILFVRTEGGAKVERWVKKFDLLGTHTMRRSFATNAFKAGVEVASIMKMTGHKSFANFMKYIRLSDEEHADLVSKHPHFR